MATEYFNLEASAQPEKSGMPGHPGVTLRRMLLTQDEANDSWDKAAEMPDGRSLYMGLAFVNLEPEGEIKLHIHRQDPIYDHGWWIVDGDVLVTNGEIEERVGPGTLVYQRSNVPHGIKNVGTSTARVLVLNARLKPHSAADGGPTFISQDEKLAILKSLKQDAKFIG